MNGTPMQIAGLWRRLLLNATLRGKVRRRHASQRSPAARLLRPQLFHPGCELQSIHHHRRRAGAFSAIRLSNSAGVG